MATSPRFRVLKNRLAELRRHMLPKSFSPTGTYPDRIIDRAKGYRLLAHAEIESFIEDVAREAATNTIAEWTKSRKANDLIVCFLAAYHSGWATDEDTEENPKALPPTARPKIKDSVAEALQNAMRQYMHTILENHGVREANIKQILLPLGIRMDELDATWVTNMDDFGKRRGEVAHKTVGAHRAVDPKTELDVINDLLKGLKEVDELIIKLTR